MLGNSSHPPSDWCVYQSDPLSFNTVMNTLVDTLQTRLDLGYIISESNHQVKHLQYADELAC